MDKTDKHIMNIIQSNSRCSVKEIAQKCFISAPSASIRLQNLERNGWIKTYTSIPDYEKMGYLIKSYILIDVSAKDKKKFYAYVAKDRHVLECDCITGDYSMQLKVRFKTMNQLDAFVNDLQRFGDTHTNVVFSTAVGPRTLAFSDD